MPDEKDTKLASALKQAKTTPMNFAFVAKGTNEGILIVSKKKIAVKEINDAKAECGGKKVFRGRVGGADGKMLFELDEEPPGTLAKQLKKVIQESAGLVLPVETRMTPGLGDESAEGEPSDTAREEIPSAPPVPPPPVPTGPDKASVLTRLNPLTNLIKGALAGPNGPRVQTLFAAVNGFMNKNEFALAHRALDELEPLVKPAPPPSGGDVTKRLNGLSGAIKIGLAGTQAARIQQLVVGINGAVKSQDFALANRLLDGLETLLASAGGGISVMKLGKARVEWLRTRTQAATDIGRLKMAIATEFKNDAEQRAALGEALKRLDAVVSALNDELDNDLDKVLNAQESQRPALAVKAKSTMARFVQLIDTDEIMVELDGNEVLPDMRVADPLRAKLQDIAVALG